MITILRVLIASLIALAAGFVVAAGSDRNPGVSDPDAASGKRVALVVGNSSYPGVAALRNPVNDATDIAAKLRKLDFQVTLRTNVGLRETLRTLTEFGDRVQQGAEVLFFYAGHGMQVRGKNYLIPIDAEIRTESAVSSEAVDLDQLLDKLSTARLSMVILDACRNNPFERRFRGGGQGLASINAPAGTLIAYATAPGKVASDGEGKNGLYTQELLAAMDTPGIKIEDVFKQVRANVVRKSGEAQIPWESSSLTGDFYFRPVQGMQVTSTRPTPLPALQVQSAEEIEQEYWNGIKNSRDTKDFEDYLSAYPNGRFAPLARLKSRSAATASVPLTPAPAPLISAPPAAPPTTVALSGVTRHDVLVKAPDIAENGSVVPVEVSFSPPLQAGEAAEVRIANSLATTLEVQEGEVKSWGLRVAMPSTGMITVATSGGGSGQKEVAVGRGVALASGEPLADTAQAKQRVTAGEVRMLLNGYLNAGKLSVSGSGFRVLVGGSPFLSRNPVLAFTGSVRDGDKLQLSLR